MIIYISLFCVSALCVFLAKELLKKFLFFKSFSENSSLMIHWSYRSEVSWMRNIVLQWETPFCILVGFELRIPLLGYTWFDYYGFVRSDENHRVIISTYFKKGKRVHFRFMKNSDIPVVIHSNDEDQSKKPNAVFSPHWWQVLWVYSGDN